MIKMTFRKKYLINPKFQLSFILFSMIISTVGMTVFFFSIKYFFWSFKRMGREYGIPETHIFFKFIENQDHMMNMLFFVTSMIVFLISIVGALLLSHRVAGPINRITYHIRSLDPKKLDTVKFREGDFFIELQDAFNDLINKIRK